ncbi:Asp-tRNA(Asn)/Glu-tRNA(Gln) amidotransferase subunit GatB [Streptomyces californicus]|uniref:Asp-tRNA(Asn)/Glu-tRNA(Gln) amidotransferase subunit GatB n=1 Tax=Streptomyces californicus TaxID=67351 RepID=UPI00367D61BC
MTVTDLVSYEDALASYDPVMGLEVHVELGTKTKMFCGCSTELKQDANSQTCPVCLGLPGALPVVNEIGVESAIKIGLALHCEIAEWCRFARKNYFYPDMPKNFQTSQYDEPIAFNGYLDVQLEDGEIFRVEIERAHMEEDTGKSTHVGGATGRIHGASHSLLDYNRAGIPLIEIVTKPIEGAGARAPEVAKAYVAELRELIKALGVSEARMEMGQMRCDVNLSLRPNGTEKFGTRSETKNVNSLRSVERAARFEIQRHAAVLSSGGTIVQETRHFHEEDGSTTAGRIKDNAEDYRYFPEPDLVPVAPARAWVEELRKGLPELPRVRRARLKEEWGVSDHDMQSILNAGAVDLIVATIEAGAPADQARKWWMGELARNANETGRGLDELPITPAQVARVAALVAAGDLNDKLARQVIEGVLAGEGDPDTVAPTRALLAFPDPAPRPPAGPEAIAGNAAVADTIRGGKVAAAGALVGAVMKATRGQADAARVRELILEKLGVEG